MPELSELQHRFIQFMTGGDNQMKSLVAEQGNVSTDVRLNIYKNAYQIRLTQVLETDHEILGLYLGDELFDLMAKGFIENHPSAFTSLRHFADALPEYLKVAEPFNQHPVISELALFERRLLDVFDAANADQLTISALQEIQPENWPDMRFRFHPSTQLFNAQWNSIEIWKALKDEQQPEEAIKLQSSHWLLWRGRDRLSEFRSLTEEECNLLSIAIEGHTFSMMCECLLEQHNEETIGQLSLQYLSDWFEQGLISAISVN